MDIIVDFLPILVAFLMQMVLQFAIEHVYIPIKEPRWCFNDMKEREKVNARKMVSFSPWIKTFFAICVGVVSIDALIIWLFPGLFWDMGMNPDVILTALLIPMLFALCVMMWMFRWICYEEDTFIYRNALGIKRTFRYDAVTMMTIQKRKLVVIVSGKKIVLPVRFYGAREFASFAAEKIDA